MPDFARELTPSEFKVAQDLFIYAKAHYAKMREYERELSKLLYFDEDHQGHVNDVLVEARDWDFETALLHDGFMLYEGD